MSSPVRSPEGVWWSRGINTHERRWLGISLLTCLILFSWMVGWRMLGAQNPMGPTYRIDPADWQAKVEAYVEAAEPTDRGLVPPGDDVYIGARQWTWTGLPVVLEVGKEYIFHFGSLDVQHGFGLHRREALIEQFNLQVLPDYEWTMTMTFKHPGVYDVQCNEFCGLGHRIMHGQIIVVDDLEDLEDDE